MIGPSEYLYHHDFDRAPSTAVVAAIEKANYGIALCEVEGKGGYPR
jgi:hypothetical protein